MKQHIFKEDLNVMYVPAETFPDDVFLAHQKLHAIVQNKENREFYGISIQDTNGKIQYKAAVSERFKGEGFSFELETCQLKKGSYNYITIADDKNDISVDGNAFKIFLLKSKFGKNAFSENAVMAQE